MTGMADAIVGLWFLPVALCIIIPLTILCGWTLIKLFQPRNEKPAMMELDDSLENVAGLTSPIGKM